MAGKIDCESREVSGCCCVSEGTNNTLHHFLMLGPLFPLKQVLESDLQKSLDDLKQSWFNQHGVSIWMLVHKIASGHVLFRGSLQQVVLLFLKYQARHYYNTLSKCLKVEQKLLFPQMSHLTLSVFAFAE